MSSRYVFDKDNFDFKKSKRSFGSIAFALLKYFFITLLLAVLYYVIFSLVVNTEEESKLRRENKLYKKVFPQMLQKEKLLSDVIVGLQEKDNEIYRNIFDVDSPPIDIFENLDFMAVSDSVSDEDIVMYCERKLNPVCGTAERIQKNFERLFSDENIEILKKIPLKSPIKDISYANVGASVGQKINPFYKVSVQHKGIDLIAPHGTPVYASFKGVVSEIVRSKKGLGNVVQISNKNGYSTRYAHLSSIIVRKGQRVDQGQKIGEVGISGNSFAPHLHYEVINEKGNICDPVNYFFASISPREYLKFLLMSETIGQSMD